MSEAPRVALRPPSVRSYLAEAIEAGGGVVAELPDADALVWADPADADGLRRVLAEHPGIRWVQLPWAGIEPMLEVIDTDRTWTSGKGVYAAEVAEHALALALTGLRRLHEYGRATTWGAPAGANLLGARVTILGAGGITESLLALLAPFGCTTTVLRRRDAPLPGATVTRPIDALDATLGSTDVLFLALALTDETRGIIDRDRLAALPDHAWIVNVARGAHIVTGDLVAALVDRTLGGAALDVTDPEPLPDGHPLWSLDNCIVTPHTANTPEMAIPVLARRVRENVARFARGDELIGLVDVEAGY